MLQQANYLVGSIELLFPAPRNDVCSLVIGVKRWEILQCMFLVNLGTILVKEF